MARKPCNCSLDLEAVDGPVLGDFSYLILIVLAFAAILALLFFLCEILSNTQKNKLKNLMGQRKPAEKLGYPELIPTISGTVDGKQKAEKAVKVQQLQESSKHSAAIAVANTDQSAADGSDDEALPPEPDNDADKGGKSKPVIPPPYTRTIPAYPLSPSYVTQARMPWRMTSSSALNTSAPSAPHHHHKVSASHAAPPPPVPSAHHKVGASNSALSPPLPLAQQNVAASNEALPPPMALAQQNVAASNEALPPPMALAQQNVAASNEALPPPMPLAQQNVTASNEALPPPMPLAQQNVAASNEALPPHMSSAHDKVGASRHQSLLGLSKPVVNQTEHKLVTSAMQKSASVANTEAALVQAIVEQSVPPKPKRSLKKDTETAVPVVGHSPEMIQKIIKTPVIKRSDASCAHGVKRISVPIPGRTSAQKESSTHSARETATLVGNAAGSGNMGFVFQNGGVHINQNRTTTTTTEIEEIRRRELLLQYEEGSDSKTLAHNIMSRLLRGQQESDLLFQQIKSLESKMETMALELGKAKDVKEKVTQGVQTSESAEIVSQGQRSTQYVDYEVTTEFKRPQFVPGIQTTTQVISLEAVPKWSPTIPHTVRKSTSLPPLVTSMKTTESSTDTGDDSETFSMNSNSPDFPVMEVQRRTLEKLGAVRPRQELIIREEVDEEALRIDYDRKLNEVLETLRADVKQRIMEDQDEQRFLFLRRETNLQKEVGTLCSTLENQGSVLSNLQWNLNKFQKKISTLTDEKILLENCTREVKSGWEADKRIFQEDKVRLEELLHKMKSERQELIRNFDHLVGVKVALDSELVKYRALVEEEEQRQPPSLELTGMQNWTLNRPLPLPNLPKIEFIKTDVLDRPPRATTPLKFRHTGNEDVIMSHIDHTHAGSAENLPVSSIFDQRHVEHVDITSIDSFEPKHSERFEDSSPTIESKKIEILVTPQQFIGSHEAPSITVERYSESTENNAKAPSAIDERHLERFETRSASPIPIHNRHLERFETRSASPLPTPGSHFERIENRTASPIAAVERRFERIENRSASPIPNYDTHPDRFGNRSASPSSIHGSHLGRIESRTASPLSIHGSQFERVENRTASPISTLEKRFERFETRSASPNPIHGSQFERIENRATTPNQFEQRQSKGAEITERFSISMEPHSTTRVETETLPKIDSIPHSSSETSDKEPFIFSI